MHDISVQLTKAEYTLAEFEKLLKDAGM